MHPVGIVVKDVAEVVADYERRLGYEIRTGIIHDTTQTTYVQFLS
jgi:hypothetical protein